MIEDKYIIPMPLSFDLVGYKVGPVIDMLIMSPVVGPYCEWPKTEPKYFVITSIVKIGK